MRVIGTLKFTVEAEGAEKGGVRNQGDYDVAIDSLAMTLKTDVVLAKDDANIVVGLGGLTTVKFLQVNAIFDDPTVATPTIELLINDGSGEISMTGLEFMLVATDITSIKLTNNSDDATGSGATVFLDLVGN